MAIPEPYTLLGQSSAANAAYAVSATATMNAAQKMYWFYNQVKGDGPMDYKSTESHPEYGNSPESQSFGNFNYGVVGDALGIPKIVLDVMAGWQQCKTDHEKALNGKDINGSLNPFDHNWGDSPGDQEKINEGIKWSQDNGLTNPTTISEQVGADFLKTLLIDIWQDLADLPSIVGTLFNAAANFTPRVDPLTLDLDNDGLETVGTNAGILFDHNADGIKTGTGWVAPDDGFLVLDKNGNGLIDNGRELFGDAFVKANGQLATTATNCQWKMAA